jgi:hypothetical protein
VQSIFEDPQTGAVFQSTDGSTPERDQKASAASYLLHWQSCVDTTRKVLPGWHAWVLRSQAGQTLSCRPARAQGDLAFRPVSYTPWPVEEDYEGERVRVPVGSVTARQPRTFVFSK